MPPESCRDAYNLTPESTTYDCTLIFAYVIIKSTGLSHLDGRVNRAGSLFTSTHGQNDRGGTGNGIAAGVDHRAGGQAVGTVRDQAAVLVGVQTRRGGADQRDAGSNAAGVPAGVSVCPRHRGLFPNHLELEVQR